MGQDSFAPLRVGFLGAGQMASALARAWQQCGLLAPESLAGDPFDRARQLFEETTGLRSHPDNREVVAQSDIILLAVKPQTMPELLHEVASVVAADQLVISIAAGVSLSRLTEGLGGRKRLIRVMPNTPCLVGASASGFALGSHATEQDAALVERLFNTVGRAFALPESLLDAVTGLSGSGPAYVYMIIEALSDGAVRMGLPREVATTLAAQTLLGAARMVLETRSHTSQLKDMVTSPGGTTIAGLHELERGGVRAALMNAVEAATRRAQELG